MNQRNRWLLTAIGMLMLFLLVGCGEEIVRVNIQAEGDYQVEFQHDGSPVAFWTDWDVEYAERPEAYYEIMAYQNGDQVAEFLCDPFDVQLEKMPREAEVRGTVKHSYLGLMRCEQDLPAGDLRLDVRFFVDGRMTIFRADLVLKQPE